MYYKDLLCHDKGFPYYTNIGTSSSSDWYFAQHLLKQLGCDSHWNYINCVDSDYPFGTGQYEDGYTCLSINDEETHGFNPCYGEENEVFPDMYTEELIELLADEGLYVFYQL